MENKEGCDGGQKRDPIMCLLRIDSRDPRYLYNISSGASLSALEHDCGRRTAVIVVSSLLTSLLSWLRYCCGK